MIIAKKPSGKYVAWIDIMGSGMLMKTSIYKIRVATEKLHSAIQFAATDKVSCFPMNDGAFLVSSEYFAIRRCLVSVYRELNEHNKALILKSFNTDSLSNAYESLEKNTIKATNVAQLVLVRSAVAYGPTVSSLPEEDPSLEKYGRVVLGPAVSNAYSSEAFAGPFGIFVHESARMHGELRFSQVFMRYGPRNNVLWNEIAEVLKIYFKIAGKFPAELNYNLDRQREHQALSREYFRNPEI